MTSSTELPQRRLSPWRERMHEILFEADTRAGRWFDLGLIVLILLSLLVVMLESVREIRESVGGTLLTLEWTFTIVFTVEYVLRILCVRRPWRYVRSFFGVIDLVSVIPTYLSVFLVGAQSLLVIRTLRLLRIFRVMKLARFLVEGRELIGAMRASSYKITVFLTFVLCVVAIMGALMFLLEGGENGFSSIPRSMYWAIVTMTTVGYGTVVPTTPLGQILSAALMILGYAIIAVPTGIVSAQIIQHSKVSTQACPSCSKDGHDSDAKHCKFCGEAL